MNNESRVFFANPSPCCKDTMVGRTQSLSPGRARSPTRVGTTGRGSEGGISPPGGSRSRLTQGRLSPVVTPIMRGIRRMRRSTSSSRRSEESKSGEGEGDTRNVHHHKFPSRLPFFHHGSTTDSSTGKSTLKRPSGAPMADSFQDIPSPGSRCSQSDVSSTASPPTPPVSLLPTRKTAPTQPAQQKHRAPPQASLNTPSSTSHVLTTTQGKLPISPESQELEKQEHNQPVYEEEGEGEGEERHHHHHHHHHQQQQQVQEQEHHHIDEQEQVEIENPVGFVARRSKLYKGLSGLDEESLKNMEQIKKDIMEMRVQRRKVKFTGKDPRSTTVAETNDDEKSASVTAMSDSASSIFKSPPIQTKTSINTWAPSANIRTPSSRSYGAPSSRGSSASTKKKMGLGEITMRDLDLSYVKREDSERSLDAALQKEIQQAGFSKEIRKAKKLIKRTSKDIWAERDQITEMQRNNWQVRKKLVSDHNIPKDTVTTLNIKIEKSVRQEREVDAELDQLHEEKLELEGQCASLAKAISDLKDLLEELHVQVVPLLPTPGGDEPTYDSQSPSPTSPSTRSSHPLPPMGLPSLDDTMHST